jgi:hypothetical protein
LLPKLPDMTHGPATDAPRAEPRKSLTIKQTSTGYWAVQRGSVQVAFAMTREAAEHERETLQRLSLCSTRRAGSRSPARA